MPPTTDNQLNTSKNPGQASPFLSMGMPWIKLVSIMPRKNGAKSEPMKLAHCQTPRSRLVSAWEANSNETPRRIRETNTRKSRM